MTATATNYRAYLIGDTYAIKAALKAKGWQWDAARKAWYSDGWSDDSDVEATVRRYPGVRNRGSFTATLEAK